LALGSPQRFLGFLLLGYIPCGLSSLGAASPTGFSIIWGGVLRAGGSPLENFFIFSPFFGPPFGAYFWDLGLLGFFPGGYFSRVSGV